MYASHVILLGTMVRPAVNPRMRCIKTGYSGKTPTSVLSVKLPLRKMLGAII